MQILEVRDRPKYRPDAILTLCADIRYCIIHVSCNAIYMCIIIISKPSCKEDELHRLAISEIDRCASVQSITNKITIPIHSTASID